MITEQGMAECRKVAKSFGLYLTFISKSDQVGFMRAKGWTGDDKDILKARGFTYFQDECIYIFNDESEIDSSVLWITYHEIAHYNVYRSGLRMILWRVSGSPKEEDLSGDDAHEKDFEERICNEYATQVVGECYDRPWLRQEQEKKDSGEK